MAREWAHRPRQVSTSLGTAQSDIYNAVTLAGVVGTDCEAPAGPLGADMTTEQQARLDTASASGAPQRDF
ncbi:hypothetical protein [Candidatus Poriferisodalis sp.]|uniref:hypothetical protein n=1 Tax=Candidatus Poriferisodalis sp. TaxID=3101277 RepID=UPI003B52F76B